MGFLSIIALIFVSTRLADKFVPLAVFLSARHSTSHLSCTLSRPVGIQNIVKHPKQEARVQKCEVSTSEKGSRIGSSTWCS